MKIGRRPAFFASLMLVCLVLIPATPSQYVWVDLFCAGLALFWAILLGAEAVSRQRSGTPPQEY